MAFIIIQKTWSVPIYQNTENMSNIRIQKTYQITENISNMRLQRLCQISDYIHHFIYHSREIM